MRKTADIIIVGAGALGCSTAYHLAQMGAENVLVVDKGDICSGETAKAGGFIQSHWVSLDEVRLIHRSREMFRQWEEIFGESCGWTHTGYLHVTGEDNVDTVRQTHEMLLSEGIESQWLEPIEIKRLQPILNVRDLVGAAYEPQSGWADTQATTRSLARAAQKGGIEFALGTAVHQICHREGKITGVETEQGFVSAPIVVLCAGPWSPSLHPLASQPLPIRAKRGQVCYISRPNGLPKNELCFYDEVTGIYTLVQGDRCLLGIDYDFTDVWNPNRYNRDIDAEYVELALGALAHRFPLMGTADLVEGVVGLYDFTPDGHPIIDGPEALGLEGYHLAAGFSGAGFKSSPMTGLGLAEMILKGRPETVNLDFLRYSRFTESDHWIGWE